MIPESLWINSVLALGSFGFAFFVIFFFGYLQAKKKKIKLKPRRIFVLINKYSIVIGLIFIIIGVAFVIPILDGSESMFLFDLKRIKHETQPPPSLIPTLNPNGYFWSSDVPPYILTLNRAYFNIRYFGFLSLGLLLILIGAIIIFTKVFHGQKKHSELNKMEWNTKRNMVLVSVTVLFLLFFGYLMNRNIFDYEWRYNGWSFGGFDFFSSSLDGVFFVSLLIVCIFVLPLLIFKIGFLDNSPNESQAIIVENEPIIKETQISPSGLIEFLKSGFSLINNYMLPVGLILTIFGGCFMALPSRFLIDSDPMPIRVGTEDVFIEYYYGLIRGQLLLIGIPFLFFGLILIIRYTFETMTKEQKLKVNKILLLLNKYSPVFGVVFVIIGAVFLITTLIEYGVNIIWVDWYIKNYFWHLRLPLLLTGFLLLVIGLILIIRYIRHKLRN
ncbi:hypothetical protein AC477_01015 [miscellaneous Crenarchaeota group-1 archaeon SG8-32-1]|uniref:Uncharacterized protein n=1 Tax=miscellaneous Crenarchaeota group-1 archaeon SG8-32-1 TaxID=1685124 RepID=A0A0M0BZU2_9ARCH|nr:MAG: hypothetical protein AC477_01015 [miscellaneous Crenarchaeota group-1 archaeon SG8-32-1]